jgi:hypothetical protein
MFVKNDFAYFLLFPFSFSSICVLIFSLLCLLLTARISYVSRYNPGIRDGANTAMDRIEDFVQKLNR